MKPEVGPAVADTISTAKIPLIAVDVPHPNATYFGVDNYRVGFETGSELAAHALREWGGDAEWVVGLDLPSGCFGQHSGITGAFEGVRNSLVGVPDERFVRIKDCGSRNRSCSLVAEFLERNSYARHILIAAASDLCALGAADAVRNVKPEIDVAIVGQNCSIQVLEEMTMAESPLIGSVSHEASSYGHALIYLGLAILGGQAVAPYNYVNHRILTARSFVSALLPP